MAAFQYSSISKYLIDAECLTPLHIGAADSEKNEVLVHPITKTPFVQATGIAGILRYVSEAVNGKKTTDSLFGKTRLGENENAMDFSSRVRITDGIFDEGTVKLEHRPRVRINASTGSVSSSVIGGSDRQAGHKFDIESVGAGAEFSFALYLFGDEGKDGLDKVFSELKSGFIQLGGQKSNGNGLFIPKAIRYKRFDMTTESGRKDWAYEEILPYDAYEDICKKLEGSASGQVAYEIHLIGQTEGAILVKGAGVTECGKDAPDAENLQNADGDCVIPGSSVKGVLRSRMEYIARVTGTYDIVYRAFGRSADETDDGFCGCLTVKDSVIGDKEKNQAVPNHHRIHIDKFTGGVMNGGLFSEKEAYGKIDICVLVKVSADSNAVAGLTLLAMRDIASGIINFGSGYSIGNGFINVSTIEMRKPEDNTAATIDIAMNTVNDPSGLIDACIQSLRDRR